MSKPARDDESSPAEDFVWRIQKLPGSNSADIALGDMYADLSGPELTAVMHRIGEGLIKVGTQLLQSRIGDEDEWEDW